MTGASDVGGGGGGGVTAIGAGLDDEPPHAVIPSNKKAVIKPVVNLSITDPPNIICSLIFFLSSGFLSSCL